MTPRKNNVDPNPDRPEFRYKRKPPGALHKPRAKVWNVETRQKVRQQFEYSPNTGTIRFLPHDEKLYKSSPGIYGIPASEKARRWNKKNVDTNAFRTPAHGSVPMIRVKMNNRGYWRDFPAIDVAYYLKTMRHKIPELWVCDDNPYNLIWSNIYVLSN